MTVVRSERVTKVFAEPEFFYALDDFVPKEEDATEESVLSTDLTGATLEVGSTCSLFGEVLPVILRKLGTESSSSGWYWFGGSITGAAVDPGRCI